jgi:hypothetical protein
VEKAEILTNIGILLGAIFAGIIAYFGKRPPEKPGTKDTVVAALGIEFGNRLQVDQAIGTEAHCRQPGNHRRSQASNDGGQARPDLGGVGRGGRA